MDLLEDAAKVVADLEGVWVDEVAAPGKVGVRGDVGAVVEGAVGLGACELCVDDDLEVEARLLHVGDAPELHARGGVHLLDVSLGDLQGGREEQRVVDPAHVQPRRGVRLAGLAAGEVVGEGGGLLVAVVEAAEERGEDGALRDAPGLEEDGGRGVEVLAELDEVAEEVLAQQLHEDLARVGPVLDPVDDQRVAGQAARLGDLLGALHELREARLRQRLLEGLAEGARGGGVALGEVVLDLDLEFVLEDLGLGQRGGVDIGDLDLLEVDRLQVAIEDGDDLDELPAR